MAPRVTRLRISGFKSLRNVTLDLDGLTVLIGDNGSGKSTLLEVMELLRSTTHERYIVHFTGHHGGLHRVLEHGTQEMSVTAWIDDGEAQPLVYRQEWVFGRAVPVEEVYRGLEAPASVRNGRTADGQCVVGGEDHSMGRRESFVSYARNFSADVAIVAEALHGIDVHLPFHVTASWAAPPIGSASPRGIGLVEPTTRLERFGTNLVNAYQALENDFGVDHWEETLEYIQLGLSADVRDIRLESIPGGGHLALAVETHHQGRVPAFALADGVLSYLAFVAMFRLDDQRTLLAFDEPELHLHPGLLGRVLGMFEAMAQRYPVVLATHSDRLLDGLEDPEKSVVVTELDQHWRTRLRRLDGRHLGEWIDDYRGVGELRADGELASVLAEPASEPSNGASPISPGRLAT